MTDWELHTAVAFIIFNRPARVFEKICQARPPKLLVVADGARLNRPGEAEKSEMRQFMKDKRCSLYAKTVNSVFCLLP